jgi:hypothetical protein
MIMMTGCDPEYWGLIPGFLSEDNPKTAREQFNDQYQGGFNNFNGFKYDNARKILTYPGDPPMRALGTMKFRDETIHLFPHAWVLIEQPDGKWEVARMD